MKARVTVTLKDGILDPQGVAVGKALASLGHDGLGEVRIGKYIEVELGAMEAGAADRAVREMCDSILSNPVIERYEYVID